MSSVVEKGPCLDDMGFSQCSDEGVVWYCYIWLTDVSRKGDIGTTGPV